VGDRVLAASCPIADSGLHEGAVLSETPRPERDDRPPASEFELVVVAGNDAGRAFGLTIGRSLVGRAPESAIVLDNATVSRRHCLIEVDESGAARVSDAGSANATFADGLRLQGSDAVELAVGSVIEVGAFALVLRAITEADRPRALDIGRRAGPSGTVPFNRPPRPARAMMPAPIGVPSRPAATPKPHFSVASTLGPLIMAAVMIAVTGDVRFAMFALLTPIIALGTYAESRRRTSTGNTRSRGAFEEQVAEFERRMKETSEAERARLRDLCPDPGEVLRRAALPSVRLWERRPRHEDFLRLYAGLADLPWQPEVKSGAGELPEELERKVAANTLAVSPVCVELADGGVIGVVGDRAVALATARSLLCQAAVHQGPADLMIGVFVDPGREPDWDWCKWLPHTRDPAGGERWLSGERERSERLLRQLGARAGRVTVLAVVDSDVLMEGPSAPARDLLQAGVDARHRPSHEPQPRVAGIVVASSADRLPAACTTVIEVESRNGDATVRRPEQGTAVSQVLLAGLAPPSARTCARSLARFEDPELERVGGGLPDSVRLLALLELERIDADSIRERWRRVGRDPGAVAPLGVTESGVFSLDLVRDGPHGLIGGTTGSGKSELLRSLVAALAVHTDAEHLTFILMDYKGGAAFDECARLPHTVGMVTDLDEGLGERALEALEAEISYRERLLRSAGADNLTQYLAGGGEEPLPRLLVVIDEFATMAKDFPEFLTSLVSVAQRGRTLGVHMILATQRPSGAVNDNIRTNTNLRIALRVQDADDSIDVIGSRDAAELSRHRPGRAYVRLGPAEIVPIQTALVTCVTGNGTAAAVEVAPFSFAGEPGQASADGDGASTGSPEDPSRSDLARLVDAVVEANAAAGIAPPRRPWPEPLPARIDLNDLSGGAGAAPELRPQRGSAAVALADDPRAQSQYPVGWDLDEGNLLLVGIPGSGTTTTLASLALSLAEILSPGELELYAFDYGAGDLAPLEGLAHCGSVILATDRERQMRLIRHLRTELDRRRSEGPGSAARMVILIDNLGGMRAEFDDLEGLELFDALTRVYADGREVGICFAASADRLGTVPGPWAAITTQKWLFRLPDPYDYVSAGLSRRNVPAPIAGRAVMAPAGLQIQVGQPTPTVAAAVTEVAARRPAAGRRARPIERLPAEVALASLGSTSRLSSEPWRIPIGVRESDLSIAELVLYEGEHALVAGPARSGKSTALRTIAESLRSGGSDGALQIVATGGRRSPLRECPALDRFAGAGDESTTMLASLRTAGGPVVVLIDDGEDFDDGDGAIEGLLSAAQPDLHVVAAGRSESLRAMFGHWTKIVARSKTGLLLRPNIDFDGDLLGATLPRRAPVQMSAGRGYAVSSGEVEVVQVGMPAHDRAVY
jgi:S-DNA-T family DNA segregation ATPase FtsK/SpoIIIE